MLNERHLVVGVALLLFACGDGRLQRYGVSDAGPASDANVVTLPDGNTVPAVDAAGAQDSGELADAGVDVANAPDVEVEMGPVLRDGLAVEYFSNYHDSTGEQTEAKVDHDWGEGAPSGVSVNHFSARWEGFVEVPSAGGATAASSGTTGRSGCSIRRSSRATAKN